MSERHKNVLIVVTADPRASGRAAEAVRIAAGVGGWEKVAVKVCFCAEARLALTGEPDDLVNGEVFAAYLPLLLEGGPRVFTLADGPAGLAAIPRVQPVTLPELAAMGREADSVLRF
jgi:hypothetical protein